ncbi:hypothetical protein [Nocardioides lentus]
MTKPQMTQLTDVAARERAAAYLGTVVMPDHEDHLDDCEFANLADALAEAFAKVDALYSASL